MVQITGERIHKRLADGKYVEIHYTAVPLKFHDMTVPPNSYYTWDGTVHAIIAESTLETGYAPAGWGKQVSH